MRLYTCKRGHVHTLEGNYYAGAPPCSVCLNELWKKEKPKLPDQKMRAGWGHDFKLIPVTDPVILAAFRLGGEDAVRELVKRRNNE